MTEGGLRWVLFVPSLQPVKATSRCVVTKDDPPPPPLLVAFCPPSGQPLYVDGTSSWLKAPLRPTMT